MTGTVGPPIHLRHRNACKPCSEPFYGPHSRDGRGFQDQDAATNAARTAQSVCSSETNANHHGQKSNDGRPEKEPRAESQEHFAAKGQQEQPKQTARSDNPTRPHPGGDAAQDTPHPSPKREPIQPQTVANKPTDHSPPERTETNAAHTRRPQSTHRPRRRGRLPRQVPMEFTIFDSGIAERADKPLFRLSQDPKPADNHVGVSLHAGPLASSPVLASLRHRTLTLPGWATTARMDVVLEPAVAARPDGLCEAIVLDRVRGSRVREYLYRALRGGMSGAGGFVFTMEISLPTGLEPLDFEWRRARGLGISALCGAEEWVLLRKPTPGEDHLGPWAGDEAVARIAQGSRRDLGTRFEFAGSASRGELGDGFSLVALMSGIGIMLAEKRSLGGSVDAWAVLASRREVLAQAAMRASAEGSEEGFQRTVCGTGRSHEVVGTQKEAERPNEARQDKTGWRADLVVTHRPATTAWWIGSPDIIRPKQLDD
ncbi:hypothetical protein EsH8_I_001361 [Colletotrichum jinshuiense]